MKILLIILISLFFFNCEHKHSQQNLSSNKFKIPETDTICTECLQKDTISPLGVKIHYKFKNGVFKIICSNNSFIRELDSSFTCTKNQNGVWDFVPKLKHETKNYLVFENIFCTSGGANPMPLAYSAIVVSKLSKGIIKEYPILEYCKGNYLLYLNAEDFTIHLLNLETNKIQDINLENSLGQCRMPNLCINSVKIENNKLKISYTRYIHPSEMGSENIEDEIVKEVIDLKI